MLRAVLSCNVACDVVGGELPSRARQQVDTTAYCGMSAYIHGMVALYIIPISKKQHSAEESSSDFNRLPTPIISASAKKGMVTTLTSTHDGPARCLQTVHASLCNVVVVTEESKALHSAHNHIPVSYFAWVLGFNGSRMMGMGVFCGLRNTGSHHCAPAAAHRCMRTHFSCLFPSCLSFPRSTKPSNHAVMPLLPSRVCI